MSESLFRQMAAVSEALLLRQLAASIERLDAIEKFDHIPSVIKLYWVEGSALPGFQETSSAMAEIVLEQFTPLKEEAVRRARAEVDKQRAELARYREAVDAV